MGGNDTNLTFWVSPLDRCSNWEADQNISDCAAVWDDQNAFKLVDGDLTRYGLIAQEHPKQTIPEFAIRALEPIAELVQ